MKFNLGLPTRIHQIMRSVIQLSQVETLYARAVQGEHLLPAEFAKRILEALGIQVHLPPLSLQRLREIHARQTPLIFAANHPFGAVDALTLMVMMGEIQPAFKFLANSIFEIIPELSPALISMHIDGKTSPKENIASMKGALRHLKQGGVLGLFPAGQVSELPSWRSRKAEDQKWSAHLGGLIRRSQATVVPVAFEGQNSPLFLYAGLLAPRLRIALLVREMLKHRLVVARIAYKHPFIKFCS